MLVKLPVLTFGNCTLKTGVIKWPLKLYVRFLRFFSKSKKHDFFAHVYWNTAVDSHSGTCRSADLRFALSAKFHLDR